VDKLWGVEGGLVEKAEGQRLLRIWWQTHRTSQKLIFKKYDRKAQTGLICLMLDINAQLLRTM